jgi:hypothetical protein
MAVELKKALVLRANARLDVELQGRSGTWRIGAK